MLRQMQILCFSSTNWITLNTPGESEIKPEIKNYTLHAITSNSSRGICCPNGGVDQPAQRQWQWLNISLNIARRCLTELDIFRITRYK